MKNMHKSPWLLHYDGSSCNGCDIEVLACTTPVYDVERFGVINTGNPMHADIFLVTGGINSQNEAVVKQIYSQMPSPYNTVFSDVRERIASYKRMVSSNFCFSFAAAFFLPELPHTLIRVGKSSGIVGFYLRALPVSIQN